MMADKRPPGLMLYFETRRLMKRMSYEEKGILFDAMMDYAQFGKEPDFEDRMILWWAWDDLQVRIDEDYGKYLKKVEGGRLGAKRRNERTNSEDEFGYPKDSLPTTTPTPTTTSTPTPTPSAKASSKDIQEMTTQERMAYAKQRALIAIHGGCR